MARLHINIIAVGRLKEDFWVKACAEYRKRLGRYAVLAVHEVSDRPARSEADVALTLRDEAAAIRQRLSPGAHTVMLDSAGTQLSSEALAQWLAALRDGGTQKLDFVIGGSWGIDAALKQESHTLLSLGAITLPHNLARVVLLEQLYRAFRIINHEPYHK
jgi:23S rRNA (pseudouridine1915-N3)-methyltransferase